MTKKLAQAAEGRFGINLTDYAEYLTDDIRHLWLRMHANLHLYNRTWLGVPIKQHPSDMVTMQEMIHQVRPRWVIETGTKFGGGCLFYSSILEMIGHGEVVGVDVRLLPEALEVLKHPNGKRIHSLHEFDSVSPEWLAKLKSILCEEGPVIVILDSCHDKAHVLKELEIYSKLVTPGSYLLCCDASWKYCADSPIAGEDWDWNNPHAAIMEFLEGTDSFVNDMELCWHKETYFHDGYLKRVK